MRHHFPATPVRAYPSFTYGLKIKAAITCASLFGYWNYPRSNASATTEESTVIDKAYWRYKCAKPIVRAEQKVSEALFSRGKSALKLPNGFERACSVTFAAAGDLIPANGLESSKDILFENVSDLLFGADISFANQEAPVSEQNKEAVTQVGGSPPIMCCSEAQFSALAGHKGRYFTALNFANNHTLDMGIEGIEATQRLFTQLGIMDIGTPRDLREYGRGKILTKRGIKIGFISATLGLNAGRLPRNETFRIHTAKLMSKYVATDLELLKKQIEDCKKQECDFIIASIHWGYEFEFFPRLRQIEAAHTLIEEGVDLILGHHPHVIQPVEYYCPERDPDRIAIIAYSLGNLTFGWYTAPHLVLSMILKVTLSKGRKSGTSRTYIECASPSPVFQQVALQGDMKLMRIEKLQEHLNESRSYHSARYAKKLKKYADLVFGT